MDETKRRIKLVLDESVLDKYNEYYFKIHPKRKKKPIARPIHESINKWMIMNRLAMNGLKQNWKDFIVWWVNDCGLKNQMIETCTIKFTSFMPTKRRSDPDNIVPKFILDGMTESKLIVDDDGTHLKELILSTDYDKDNPRTEIEITIL